ncbi:MAG: PEP-CTERM sorting domain-containing protein [Verrucomicrobiota bacterium]
MDKASFISACVAGFSITSSFGMVNPPFIETFDTNDSGWLDGDSGTPDYFSSDGVGDSGYISFSPASFTTGTTGPGGFGDPLAILMRGNAGSASGDAFVGDWITEGVTEISVNVRHNFGSDLNFYARLNRGFGQAASTANNAVYSIAPNTWTKITLPIEDSNPPFLSYGGGTFGSVFSDLNDLQFGLYLPASTAFDSLKFDIDNVSVVPEPSSYALLSGLIVGVGVLLRRRGRQIRS